MFGRDVFIPTLPNLLQHKLRYLGGKSSLLCKMLRGVFMLAAINLKRARERQPNKGKRKSQNTIPH